jgi:hypothetical protein
MALRSSASIMQELISFAQWSGRTSEEPTFETLIGSSGLDASSEAPFVSSASVFALPVVGVLGLCFGTYACAKPHRMKELFKAPFKLIKGASKQKPGSPKSDDKVKNFNDVDGTPRAIEELVWTVTSPKRMQEALKAGLDNFLEAGRLSPSRSQPRTPTTPGARRLARMERGDTMAAEFDQDSPFFVQQPLVTQQQAPLPNEVPSANTSPSSRLWRAFQEFGVAPLPSPFRKSTWSGTSREIEPQTLGQKATIVEKSTPPFKKHAGLEAEDDANSSTLRSTGSQASRHSQPESEPEVASKPRNHNLALWRPARIDITAAEFAELHEGTAEDRPQTAPNCLQGRRADSKGKTRRDANPSTVDLCGLNAWSADVTKAPKPIYVRASSKSEALAQDDQEKMWSMHTGGSSSSSGPRDKRSRESLSKDTPDDLFNQIDKDNDGVISCDELCRALRDGIVVAESFTRPPTGASAVAESRPDTTARPLSGARTGRVRTNSITSDSHLPESYIDDTLTPIRNEAFQRHRTAMELDLAGDTVLEVESVPGSP